VRDAIVYAALLLVFIVVAFGLSWLSIYAFWFAAYGFHSVLAVRACEFIGSVVLLPVRVVFWSFGDFFDQSAPLTDPISYAGVNGVLLGAISYSCCRRFLVRKLAGVRGTEL
jgi:hypothetical protein